ncbi:MAG TPA: nitroreductase family deazaflavin-dependent oxidoreductase [Propionibacteriaceae bacterium]|nr:nitroreductase family deazaflavin-dependent oxidoreductase [Propionibacteriaceae bacterium]
MINFEQQRSGLRRRIVGKAAPIIPMSALPARALPRIDRAFFRLSRRRTTFSAWVSGLPIVMLTTTGARTGQPRNLPVLGLPVGDRLVLIASNFGRPQHPGWYYNLRARPYAMVTWNGSAVEMRARELAGEERRRYLTRSHQAYPWWEQYHRRAAPRQIPVIMLEPIGA